MSDLLVDIGCAAVGGAVALGLLLHLRKRQARGVERRSRPAALRDAELVHVEKTFRTTSPVPIAAKLDRAYRLPSGQLVLLELKTRWNGGPNLSDVIQLSAQRVAVMGQTHQAVVPYAYVMVKAPTRRALPTVHRVQLMTDEQVVALVKRREEILAGRGVLPRKSSSLKTCDACAFRADCDSGDK